MPMPIDPTVEWRRTLPVLVTDAQAMGSIAVIRSLGRGGYPVHACSAHADALGLTSKYAHARAVYPDDENEFLAWLRDYVLKHGIRALVPSERVLIAIRPVFDEFVDLLPFSHDPDILYAGLSKFDLLARLNADRSLAEHLPPMLLVSDTSVLPDSTTLTSLGTPLFIKTDGTHSVGHRAGGTYKVASAADASRLLGDLSHQVTRLTVQGYVPGQGVGVFFLVWNNEVVAEFMHRRLHEVPHTGGVSSLRESWWHPVIRNDALQKVQSLCWQGVAMLEYRWDPHTDDFYLMEMNGRFWGSLHLALYAGVDFPVLLLDCFHGHQPSKLRQHFEPGVRCRHTFPMEVQYVWSRLKDRTLPVSDRLGPVAEFFRLTLDRAVRSDLLFPGDERLYWINLRRLCVKFLSNRRPNQP